MHVSVNALISFPINEQMIITFNPLIYETAWYTQMAFEPKTD